MIEMKHINLSFKDKALFADQEIKIDSGKITLITGESGSGKSTLLFELARLTDYADKEYIYENEKMSDLDEESLAMLVESLNTIPFLTSHKIVVCKFPKFLLKKGSKMTLF